MSSQTQHQASIENVRWPAWQISNYKPQSRIHGHALSAWKITSLCLHKEPSVVSSAEIPPEHCAPLLTGTLESKHRFSREKCTSLTTQTSQVWLPCHKLNLSPRPSHQHLTDVGFLSHHTSQSLSFSLTTVAWNTTLNSHILLMCKMYSLQVSNGSKSYRAYTLEYCSCMRSQPALHAKTHPFHSQQITDNIRTV